MLQNPEQRAKEIQGYNISFNIAKKVLNWTVGDMQLKEVIRELTTEAEFIK